jgi:peptidoglycan/LPS O-acetylase OafA/YrhL
MMKANLADGGDTTKAHDRMFGLDVCRAIAILSVVVGHMLGHSSPHPAVASIAFLAIFGVDLFFCLSGFLIGGILLRESAKWPEKKEQGLIHFWYRRWMRTLPLYFFFFFVELNLFWGGASSILSQLSYLVFSQNLAWPMSDFYRVTWSLTIEEWFYFLFPLLILLWIGLGKSPRSAVLITIVLFIFVPPVVRFLLFGDQYGFDSLDPNIRHVVLFRLDSIGFGVLLAYIHQWHKALFQKIAEMKWFIIIAAVSCIAYIKFHYFGMIESRFVVTFYFSIVAIVFAGLMPFFVGLAPSRFNLLNRFVKYTSLISYSMYLGHTIAFIAGIAFLKKLGLFDIIYPNPWLAYPIFVFLVYLLSSLTYFVIEKPVLAIRDRQSKDSSVACPQAPTTA